MPARIVVLSVLLAALAGCDAYKADLLESAEGPGRLPARPAPSLTDAGPDLELVYGLHNVILNQSDATLPPGSPQLWQTIGLNLDGQNTRADTDPNQPCQRPNSNGGLSRIDGQNGIDNLLGSTLWPNISDFVGGSAGAEVFEQSMNDGFEAGKGTIVLRILRWNGTANDDSVEVWLFPAAAGTTSAHADIEFTPGTNALVLLASPSTSAAPPAWDGSATSGWYADKEAFADENEVSPMMPVVRDLNGYISNGTLVMSMAPDDILELRVADFASVAVQLSDAHIVARLSEDFASIDSGFIAGRFSLDNLFDVGGSVGICGTLQGNVQGFFNRMADVLADPSAPGGPSAICDAVSVGVAFQGRRGEYRGVAPEPLCMPDLCDGVSCTGN
jgi:hypothetical protein